MTKLNPGNRDDYVKAFKALMAAYIDQLERRDGLGVDTYFLNMLPIARHIADNIDDVYVGFLDAFLGYDKVQEYLARYRTSGYGHIAELLEEICRQCYGNTRDPTRFMTLEQQNEVARNYPRFDYSSQRPLALKDLKQKGDRIMAKTKKTEAERVKVYSTKLYPTTEATIKALAKAGEVIYGKGYGERQVIESMLEAYREFNPAHFAAAEKLLAAEDAIRESVQDDGRVYNRGKQGTRSTL